MITADTVRTCVVAISTTGVDETELMCGTDLSVGCTVMYQFSATDGGYYRVYDSTGALLEECVHEPASVSKMCGGGFVVTDAASRLVFCPNMKLSKTADLRVGDIITQVSSLEQLYELLAQYGFADEDLQQVVNLFLEQKGGSGGASVVVDATLSTTSTNPVQNKVITEAINSLQALFDNLVDADGVKY